MLKMYGIFIFLFRYATKATYRNLHIGKPSPGYQCHAIKNNKRNHSREYDQNLGSKKNICVNKIEFLFYFDLYMKYSKKCFTPI